MDCEDCSWQETYQLMRCSLPYEEDGLPDEPTDTTDGYIEPVPNPDNMDKSLVPETLVSEYELISLEPVFGICGW
jgi:hypothetical protein